MCAYVRALGVVRMSTIQRILSLVGVTLVAVLAFGAMTAAAGQIPPESIVVEAKEGSIDLSWSGAAPGSTFAVWRATDSTTGRARVIGFTEATSFIDMTAIVGAQYKYAVVTLGDDVDFAPGATDYTATSVSLTADNALSPHRSGARDPLHETCVRCHTISNPVPGTPLLADLDGTVTDQTALCGGCHYHEPVVQAFSVGVSGHTVPVGGSEGSVECGSCHDPHADVSSNGALLPSDIDTARVNGLCDLCHTGSSIAELSAPEKDLTGYPVSGTYPGPAVFESSAGNAHAALVDTTTPGSELSRPAGSCLYCHGAHRTASPYDGLLVIGDPAAVTVPNAASADVASLCATCHGWVAPSDTATPEEIAEWGVHLISSPGGTFEPGTSLPCYACHNPHGSARGNGANISDALGANLDPVNAQREFCFTCHSTSDGFGWDSDAAAYASIPVEEDEIFGLSRTAKVPGEVTGAVSKLAVPAIGRDLTKDFHSSTYTGIRICADCHTSAHHPELDGDGLTCYTCHSETMGMDKADPAKTETFHHVLGSSTTEYTGDPLLADYVAPSAGNGWTKTCLSCHTDHTDAGFEGTGPLRSSTEDSATATSDFMTAENPGVCVDCHGTALDRGPTGDQKKAFVRISGGAEVTTVKAIEATSYAASAHNYDVVTSGGWIGNCSKCHNSGEVAADGMSFTSSGVHESANRSLLALVGDDSASATWNTNPVERRNCLSCHARRGELAQSTIWGKELADKDWFGVKTMSARTIEYKNAAGAVIGTRNIDPQSVFSDMYRTTGVDLANPIAAGLRAPSGHQPEKPVVMGFQNILPEYKASTTSVRCSDCHDVHVSGELSRVAKADWPLTKQPLPVGGEGQAFIRNRINLNGVATDGSRLLTLNDYVFARDNPTSPEAVDILCMDCHVSLSSLHSASVHLSSFTPCVACHTPNPHGGGMSNLIADKGPEPMPIQHRMTWYEPWSNQINVPVAQVWSYTTMYGEGSMAACATDCHYTGPNSTLPGWENWR